MPNLTATIGPRVVDGLYYNGYWRQEYVVRAIDGDFLTVQWDDGRVTTHCTAWDPDRDKVIAPTVMLRNVELPYSEACMYLRIAGKRFDVELLPGGAAQLWTLDGDKFSFPITRGEAGVLT